MSPRSRRSLAYAVLLAAALVLAPAGLSAQTCAVGSDEPVVVAGVVRDADLRIPLVGSRTRATWTNADGTAEERAATTADADGRFAFCGLPPTFPIRLVARAGGRTGPEHVVRISPSARSPLYVELDVPLDDPEAFSGLSGLIVDRDGRQPVAGADVRLESFNTVRVTNREGGFAFGRVPAGSYVLHVEHLAFGTFVDTVHLAPARPLHVRIPITTEPIPVEGIEVTVRSTAWMRRRADLFERMDRGAGRFITRSEIADRGEPPISSLLRSVPGIVVERAWVAGREVFYPVFRGSRIPALYVDGARVSLDPALGYGIDEFLSHHVDVIEIQMGPATVPIGVPGSCSGCGVIHLWTKAP